MARIGLDFNPAWPWGLFIYSKVAKIHRNQKGSPMNLPKTPFTLSFPLDDLSRQFTRGGMTEESILGQDPNFASDYLQDREFGRMNALNFRFEDGELTTTDRQTGETVPVPPEVLDEVRRCYDWAAESGTQQCQIKELISTVERALEQFENYGQYEYHYYTKDGENAFQSGRATGIKSIVFDEKERRFDITFDPDIVHVINEVIAGVGFFSVNESEDGSFIGTEADDGETPQQYTESRFHHLASWWEVFGSSKPKPDFRNCDDFDDDYFIELLNEVQQQYPNLDITDRKPKAVKAAARRPQRRARPIWRG